MNYLFKYYCTVQNSIVEPSMPEQIAQFNFRRCCTELEKYENVHDTNTCVG